MTGLRIVVLGYIVRGPLGGMAWHHLQYILGLRRLGHEVFYLEDSDDYPSCYDPSTNLTTTDPSFGLRFANSAFDRIGLGDRWSFFDAHTGLWHGPAEGSILRFCAEADLLVNVSGLNPIREWLHQIENRIFIDTDPVFTQIRHLVDDGARQVAEQHTAYFSFGEHIEAGTSQVPADGFQWRTTRQPVVLDAWKVTPAPGRAPFTTVMQWDSYAAREYGGRSYGMKSDSFGTFLDLPRRAGQQLELALGSPNAPRDLLRAHGWAVRHPYEPTRDPWQYQHYIQQSKGEFSVAKHGYVVSNSGWFSERSANYLASGRPVVTQDTGFSAYLPSGRGLFAVRTLDEAVDAFESIDRDYAGHCQAAREIAEAHFDSNRVLTSLLERAMS